MLIFIKKLRAARIEPPALSRIFGLSAYIFLCLALFDDLAQNDDRDRYQHGDGYDYRQPADEPHDEIADTLFQVTPILRKGVFDLAAERGLVLGHTLDFIEVKAHGAVAYPVLKHPELRGVILYLIIDV